MVPVAPRQVACGIEILVKWRRNETIYPLHCLMGSYSVGGSDITASTTLSIALIEEQWLQREWTSDQHGAAENISSQVDQVLITTASLSGRSLYVIFTVFQMVRCTYNDNL